MLAIKSCLLTKNSQKIIFCNRNKDLKVMILTSLKHQQKFPLVCVELFLFLMHILILEVGSCLFKRRYFPEKRFFENVNQKFSALFNLRLGFICISIAACLERYIEAACSITICVFQRDYAVAPEKKNERSETARVMIVLVRICCLARSRNNKTKILQYIYLNTIFFIFKKP